MKLVIIAWGKGTRLGLTDRPKPMALVLGRPVLEYQVELARRYGIQEIVMLIGHMGEVIERHFGNGEKFGVSISYVKESEPLWTAGSVKQLEDLVNERFLVFYGDMIMDFDIAKFIRFDAETQSIASIIVHPNDHPYDSDLVETDETGRVIAFHSKPHPEGFEYQNLVNAAIYILSPQIFKYLPVGIPSDFGKDIFPKIVSSDGVIRAYGTHEYMKDMGTPERLKKVEEAINSGRLQAMNRDNPQRAVFLDRDGVINVEKDHIRDPKDFELLPGVAEAIKAINRSGQLCVVITNQAGIAKGFFNESTLAAIHKKMETLLGNEGAYLDAIYYCPHHPEAGHPNERPELKIPCNCRKPGTGLIERACNEHWIDPKKSYFIGDRSSDILAGRKSGMRTILVVTGYVEKDGTLDCVPDFSVKDLQEAVNLILSNPS